jgi:transcriptional regulator with XRE-family HTH domain
MTGQNGRAFNEWLRAQLKAKKMSQRQLALQSGVDHSTISRLIRGDRMPSLGTATKLARGLRELRDDAEMPVYLGVVNSGPANPTARVEYSLRADEVLSEAQVRQIMEYYLAVRMRRLGRSYRPENGEGSLDENGGTNGHANGGSTPNAAAGYGAGRTMGTPSRPNASYGAGRTPPTRYGVVPRPPGSYGGLGRYGPGNASEPPGRPRSRY